MNNKRILSFGIACMMSYAAVAAGTVSGVTARQRYPWNGMVDIDCTVTGTAGTTYSLTVNARDKVGGTNLTVKTVSVEGESASGNPVSVTSGVYRLVWNADTDLPNGFRGEKVSISVTVTDSAKKFMIVDLSTGAITYQATAPEGGWDVDEYKGTKMAFVRIEPTTFEQRVINNAPGRMVTIEKPFYMGLLPVTHKQLRTLCGDSYTAAENYTYSYNDSTSTYAVDYSVNDREVYKTRWGHATAPGAYRGNGAWPLCGRTASAGSPIGILRTRTDCEKFDLPTEAEATLAMKSFEWAGKCLCLDMYAQWLGTDPTIDPCGVNTPEADTVSQMSGYTKTVSVWVNESSRGTVDYGTTDVGTRFCLYEAD